MVELLLLIQKSNEGRDRYDRRIEKHDDKFCGLALCFDFDVWS